MLPTVVFWLLLVLTAWLNERLPWAVTGHPVYYLSTTIMIDFVIFAWFLADAADRRVKPDYLLKMVVVALPFIAVPYYRFRYTGFWRGLRFLTIVAGLFVVLMVYLV